jgi:DNA-binding transcriptional MocR family regulator
MTRLAASPLFAEMLHYHASAGRAADRAAGAAWIARSGLKAVPERVIVTNSGQHALSVIFTALTRPGDAVAVESLTYPGMKALADLFGLRLVALAMDGEGLLPEAFEAACRAGQIKALYTMPTLHNPTTAVMPEVRRRRIAEIAQRHAVPVVEDDCFGFLLEGPPPPIACFAPEHAFYVGSTAKSMAPGLRVGYVHAPPDAIDRLVRVMRATTYMASPLMAAVASSWIEEGIADRLVAAKRDLLRQRGRMIAALPWSGEVQTHPAAMHLFLTLPERWRADDFVAEARRRGVGLIPGSVFAVNRNAAPNAVRLCFAAPSSTEMLERGLRILVEMLAGAPAADLSIV